MEYVEGKFLWNSSCKSKSSDELMILSGLWKKLGQLMISNMLSESCCTDEDGGCGKSWVN